MSSGASTRSYSYRVVDVFTQEPLLGNGLAVFTDASGLDDLTMQRIAREMNLSETTFIEPPTRPDCAANVRIFTPAREMPFAGHPTVGSSFVLLETGIVAKGREEFSLQEKIGPVPVRVEAGEAGRPLIWLTTPPIRFGRTYDPGRCAEALGLDVSELVGTPPEIVSAGNPGVFVAVKSKDSVDRAWFDSHGINILKREHPEPPFMFVFAPTPEGAYSRMFAPEHGVAEDPATGSATGPLAAYMMRHGLAASADGTRLISEQGTKMGRRSILHILVHGEQGRNGIEVGGYVTPVIEGVLTLAAGESGQPLHASAVRNSE
ncbi:MAG TPA: PhzF family phenazine biosynthesis protein [Bryobacteraceae bacterium]|nr:PhzF family phenazine biosynthesis protein [Bryobacteraceae bacterium]